MTGPIRSTRLSMALWIVPTVSCTLAPSTSESPPLATPVRREIGLSVGRHDDPAPGHRPHIEHAVNVGVGGGEIDAILAEVREQRRLLR